MTEREVLKNASACWVIAKNGVTSPFLSEDMTKSPPPPYTE
jgi:hypothetical protein